MKGAPQQIDEFEALVIEAAQDLADAWRGSHYGPMQHEVKKCERALADRVSDLASENDGRWEMPSFEQKVAS